MFTLISLLLLAFGRSSFFKIFLFSLLKDEITERPAAAMLGELITPSIHRDNTHIDCAILVHTSTFQANDSGSHICLRYACDVAQSIIII